MVQLSKPFITDYGQNQIYTYKQRQNKTIRDFYYYNKYLEMGRCQRGVHFGAACLKEAEESNKFPIENFCLTFLFYFTFLFLNKYSMF